MKSYIDLVRETLNQRAIIDNRNIVSLSDTSESVLIAFNQACEFMRDLHNWRWNNRTDVYVLTQDQTSFPIPYGIIHSVVVKNVTKGTVCVLGYVPELTGCDGEWTYNWETETIEISNSYYVATEIVHVEIHFHDKHIAVLGDRTTTGTLLERFSTTQATSGQYLNVPEYIYDAYARCVILKTRVFLNEGAQATIFPAQQKEWNDAYSCLMQYAKTPFYKSERMEI